MIVFFICIYIFAPIINDTFYCDKIMLKNCFWIALFCLVLSACSEECPYEHVKEEKIAYHYFYVDNQVPDAVEIHFNNNFFNDSFMAKPKDFSMNLEKIITIPPKSLTLVRVYADTNEVLNCLYFDVFESFTKGNEYGRFILDGYPSSSKNVYNIKYWDYKYLNAWEATYTLTIDARFMEEFCPKYPAFSN